MHVSFIDDNEGQIAAYRGFLEAQGCGVSYYDWADDGERFFAERSTEPELVAVLDLYWGDELKGPAILELLRKWRPGIPVIVLTSSSSTEIVLKAVQDWGATRVFIKGSSDLDKLLSVVEQSAKETTAHFAELRAALALAGARDAASQVAGLIKCRSISRSNSKPHLPALKGRYLGLRGLLNHGLEQDHLPLIEVLQELQETCAQLFTEEGRLDRLTLRVWATACKHLGAVDDHLGVACICSLSPDDALLRDLIDWQVRWCVQREMRPGPSIARWLSSVEDGVRLGMQLRLALATKAQGDEVFGCVAAAAMAQLEQSNPQAVAALEREFGTLGEGPVLEVLAAADPKGDHAGWALAQVVDGRLEAARDGAMLGLLMRTVPLLERLAKWKNLQEGWLQHRAGTIAFQLHGASGAEEARNRCLAMACQERAWNADTATTILEVLADADGERLVHTYGTWLRAALTAGQAEISTALIRWAAGNRDDILRGPIEMDSLRQLIGCLARAGQQDAAGDYAIRTLERGVRELRLTTSRRRQDTLTELRDLLSYGRTIVQGDRAGSLDEIDRVLTAIAATSHELPGVLSGKRLAILGGTLTGAGPEQLQEYKESVERGLGATCEVFEAERDMRVHALCGAIRGGGFHIVVVIKGSVSHSAYERVEEACKGAGASGQVVTRIGVPSGTVGTRAVLRSILGQLAIPVEEAGPWSHVGDTK